MGRTAHFFLLGHSEEDNAFNCCLLLVLSMSHILSFTSGFFGVVFFCHCEMSLNYSCNRKICASRMGACRVAGVLIEVR